MSMTNLKRDMTLADVVALGISAAMGVSIFSVVAPAAAVAGPAMLVSLAAASVPMVVFAIVYSFMNSAMPRTGSSYAWPAQFIHPFAGFLICWLRIVGCAGGLHIMATVFAAYLSRLVDLPTIPVMIAVVTFAFLTNLLGASTVGRVARVLVIVKLVVLTSFIVFGLPQVKAASFTPFAPFGLLGIFAALPVLVSLYTGIESAAEAGEEIKDSRRVMKTGLAIATAVGLIIYLGTAVVTIGTLGSPATAISNAPLSDAAARFGGPWVMPAMIVTALLSVAAAMNALMLVFARFLFAMGRDNVLPPAFARLNKKFGTPHVAIIVAYASALIGLVLPQDLLFLFLAANLPTMLKYGANCVAAIRLIRFHPELQQNADFGFGAAAMTRWAIGGVICSVVMLVAGTSADWRPYALLFGWAAVGVVYWFVRGRRGSIILSTPNRR